MNLQKAVQDEFFSVRHSCVMFDAPGPLNAVVVLVPGSDGDGRSMAGDSVWQAIVTGNRLSDRAETMGADQLFYEPVPTEFGKIGIVWWQSADGPRIRQVFLRKGKKPVESVVLEAYPNALPSSSSEIKKIKDRIQRFLKGEEIIFDLGRVALESCGEFQRKVLLAEYAIPRGWVSTYGRIAAKIGSAGGARAVGRALAENPFPILIPCHRAVRADGTIGGYQGGSGMKRALLAMEGVEFAGGDRVSMGKVYY